MIVNRKNNIRTYIDVCIHMTYILNKRNFLWIKIILVYVKKGNIK